LDDLGPTSPWLRLNVVNLHTDYIRQALFFDDGVIAMNYAAYPVLRDVRSVVTLIDGTLIHFVATIHVFFLPASLFLHHFSALTELPPKLTFLSRIAVNHPMSSIAAQNIK
jgi:hypothetical protein